MDTAIKDRKSKRKRKPTCKSAVVVDDKLERGDTPKKTKPRRKARQADPTIFCASQKGVLALTFATDNPSVEAIGASKTIIRLTCPSLPSSLRPQTVSHQAVPDFISLSNPPTPVSAPRPTRAAKPISYKFDPFEGVEYIADDRYMLSDVASSPPKPDTSSSTKLELLYKKEIRWHASSDSSQISSSDSTSTSPLKIIDPQSKPIPNRASTPPAQRYKRLTPAERLQLVAEWETAPMPYDAIMRCQTKAIARSVNDRRQISVDCGELIEVLGCVESRMDGMCKVRRLRDGETGYMPGAALAEDAWRMLRKVQQDRLRRTTLSESEYDDDEEDGSASGKES